MLRLAALLLLIALPVRAEPPRLVSMNLCTDQMALLLADPGQILSLSHLSGDPFSTPLFDAAQAYPLNRGGAEEIALMRPDLVLGVEYSNPATIATLQAAGLRVERFAIPSALDQIPDAVRAFGRAIGQPARGAQMAADIEDRLAAWPDPAPDAPVAAFFYPNGYSLGAGTLAHDILTAGGFRNLATGIGMAGGGRIPLEALVTEAPDLLVTAPAYPGHSRSEALTMHPALDRWRQAGRVLATGPIWGCGTPLTLGAVETVIAARAAFD